jgi:uncharacterized protein (TIGR00255 family)
MIQSMTGFGRATFVVLERTFEVEVRSVNHRHLDARVKLPRQMGDQEGALKALVQSRLERGKVDVSISPASGATTSTELQIDDATAHQYIQAARHLSEEHHISGSVDVALLLQFPGVTRFVEEGLPPEDMEAALTTSVGEALDELIAMRLAEGKSLAADFERRLRNVQTLVTFFEERSGIVMESAKERLRKRAEQITQDTGLLDEARLHQEIVIAADRLDITEELVRLRSHVEQFESILAGAGEGKPVGRRLDFLLQEMGREANTVGSKANDAPLAHHVVELKNELERIREQVQNVE